MLTPGMLLQVFMLFLFQITAGFEHFGSPSSFKV